MWEPYARRSPRIVRRDTEHAETTCCALFPVDAEGAETMTNAPASQAIDGGDLFDLGQGKLWIGFVLRSIRRRKKSWAAVFLTASALGSLAALAVPKAYFSGTTLIARNDSAIRQITLPGQSADQADPPASLAEPTIKADNNIYRIVDELALVANSRNSEGRIPSAIRGLTEKLFGAPDASTERKGVADKLRASISVSTTSSASQKQVPDTQTVEIGVLWGDPVVATKIIEAATKNYFADRRTAEVGPAEDALRIVEETKNEADKKVEQLRFDLNVPPDDARSLPDSSPLRSALDIQKQYDLRFQDARVSLKNAESAFAYRYRVVTVPEVPVAPVSGSLISIIASLIGAGILATFVTTALDVLRGRILEPWQASRRLNLPLLVDIP